MRTTRINFWIFLIIIINFVLFTFYIYGNYNYLWGTPGHLLTHNPEKVFRMFLYTWDESYNFGGSRVVTHSRILIAPLFIFLHKILDPESVYFLYKFLITIIAGISMFYFSKLIFKEFNNTQILPFLSAILYMFNPQTARWVSSNIDLMTPYALTPAILYFLMKSTSETSERKLLNIFLAAVLLSVTFLFNIGSIFVMLTLIILFTLFYSLLTRRITIIKNTFFILSLSILFIFWHILPATYHFLSNIGAWKEVGAIERFYSIRANVINTFELINAWEMFEAYNGYKIYYFSDIYENFGVLLLLIPIIIFISLLFLQKNRESSHLVIILSFICIIGIILAQGTNSSSLFSQLYEFLLGNVSIFNAIRNSTKFNHLIVFSYSLLFSYSIFILHKISNKYSKKLKYIVNTLVILLSITALSIYSAPFWSGKLFNNYTTGIPKEVILASEYINNRKEDGAVLILPGPWLSAYEWLHPYTSRPIYLSTIKENPIIFRYGGSMPLNVYVQDVLETFYKNLFSLQGVQILRILKLFRVKYILIDGTIDMNFYKNSTVPSNNITHIRQFIESIGSIRFVANFRKIYLYECYNVSPVFFIPLVYVYMPNITSNIFHWSNYYDLTKIMLVKAYEKANLIMLPLNINMSINNLQNKTIIYLLEAELDLHKSHAKIVKSSEANNGELVIFYGKGKAWQSVKIIKRGTYKIALRGVGEFKIKIGDKSFILNSNSLNFVYSPLFNLSSENHKLEITSLSDNAKLDVIWLYSTESNQTIDQLFEVRETPAKIISYEKIDPTLWKVRIHASKPFMLSFNEAYDPLWEARIYKDGKLIEKTRSVPLYSVINGFWIDTTGDLTIVIRYVPQDWFELGLKISATTFALCIFYLIWDWRRSRGDRWALGLEKVFRRALTFARK